MSKQTFITGILVIGMLKGYTQITVQSGAAVYIQAGANVTIEGDILLGDGSNLVNDGTIRIGNSSGIGSAFTDNTVTGYLYGNGSFIFNSTSNQSLSSSNAFGRIDVDGSSLMLGSNIISNKWYLIKGIIHTGSFMAVTPANAQLAIEADASNPNFSNGWFNGTLRRTVSPATVNSYVFPVGNTTQPHLAVLSNLTANALNNVTYIDASFGPKAGTDAGLLVTEQGSAYVSIHNGGVWHLTPNAAPSAGKYNLTLYLNGFASLADNQFTILRRPEGSTNGADWSVPAGSTVNANGGAGRLAAQGYAIRNNLGGFSEFGIGLLSTALPVRLTNFNVRRLTISNVQVSWQTQTEQNNKGFDIERRLDNETNFVSKGFVASQASNGNSTVALDYSFADGNAYKGVSYYRLRQVDLDDRAYYSLIKAVRGETSVNVLIWPNPNEGQFSIRLEGVDGQKEAQIMDLHGKLVQKIRIKGTQQVNIRQLQSGTYILSIPDAFGPGAHFKEKVMVVR
ncbi:T9SS C-terminal target domain-containing protein [Paraflavitalea soli]|uniref:T9SS C-terminal target domain-containing protein n=1 Tax=Paraflavitalea soli TaxID=2315862 RepID=A0A3B7MRZ5_9BACT|nr:T9SS type A sorting domain-containing protein [Paraflavitalea soli]AXY76069.1 T9SS C-terminal target domain-containing protein [Paraflavitalea soli]